MKRAIMWGLFMLIFSIGSNSFAQFPRVGIGVKGGLNLASAVTDVASIELSYRPAIGGVVDIGLNRAVSFQIEPRYIQKGGEFKLKIKGEISEIEFEQTINATWKFDYFEIPLSLNVKLLEGDITPYLFAGPVFSFLTSAKVESGGETKDIKDETESNEFSLNFGGGVAFRIATDVYLTADVRYSLGLTDIAKDELSWKSRDIRLLLGLLFNL
jgi:outer membrane protein W